MIFINTQQTIKSPTYLFYTLFLSLIPFFLFSQKDVEDIKKEAEKAFKEENYILSYKLYAQLVANFSKEPIYNYRLGVSMLYAESEKKKCIPYLEFAIKFIKKKEVPEEALFYLGKAYHINYRFDDAIKYYKEFKQNATTSKTKELQADNEIQSCENGKKLLSSIKELVVLSKKRLQETEYFRSYDLSTIGGKLLLKPEEFQTKLDKKKKDKSVIYLPKDGNKVFFSSYGEDGKNGLDIYYALRLPNGQFAKPQPLVEINTPYDEDYPFLHPNGKVLYFASKGHKGMGGYDIFKSTFDETTQKWSIPENLEFPINSPGDDFLFVTDSSKKIAFFSTSRYAPPDKIDVLKIKTERVPPLFVAIKGNVRKTEINQSIRSVIAVKNMETGDLVGTFAADENGQYYMELPNGGKFLFTVETPGFTKQSEAVNLPVSYAIKPLRQSISYEKNVLVITNYFDELNQDNAYLDIVEYIEKKAQLEVNEEQYKQTPSTPVTQTTSPPSTTTSPENNKTEISTELSAANTPIPPNNTQQLLEIVKKDAEEAQKEAEQLEIENNQLKQIIQLKNNELNEVEKNIQDTQNQINTSESNEEKEQLTQLLKNLQEKKNNINEQKNFFEQHQQDVQKKLESAKKESDINTQFAKTLEELEKTKNKTAALNKLTQLQKELQSIEKQKSEKSDPIIALTTQEKTKQEELSKLEKQKNTTETDIELLNQDISNLKKELSQTNDKTLKENLQIQINNRETELKEKQKNLAETITNIDELKEDLQSIQEQKNIITKIKNNEIPITSASVTTSQKTDKIITNNNINLITQDYNNKIKNATNSLEKKKLLEEYNQLITQSIKENNKRTAASNNTSEKQKLQNLNYELEQILKNNNEVLIAINNNPTNNNNEPTIANKNPNNNPDNNIPNITNTSTINTQPNNQQKNNTSISNLNELPISINNPNEVMNAIEETEKTKSEFNALKKQFETQTYQASASNAFKQNIPSIDNNEHLTKNIINIINSSNQKNYLLKQADSLRKISAELKEKATKSNTPNQKQKLLADAQKTDITALEKEYQSTQFNKTLNKNILDIYEQSIQQLPEQQKQTILNEFNKAKQNFQQAEQIRKESALQSNLTIKLANEQNALEKEQIALNTLSKIFKDNNIEPLTNNITQSFQNEKTQIEQKTSNLKTQYYQANEEEIKYLLAIADTSSKIKNDNNLTTSLTNLKTIHQNIQSQYKDSNNKQTFNTLLTNQLQLIQQLRQITNIARTSVAQQNNYISEQDKNKLISSTALPQDTILAIAQKLPITISNTSTQQIQTLLQEQKQIADNLKTENPILKSPEELQKNNELLNTEITQLTNKALSDKQQINQTTDQRKKTELQIEFERTNALIQEKKIEQISNEILINQSEYSAQDNLITQLTNSIPKNNTDEINNTQSALNEIKKLKKQEETLLKEALTLSNPSAQLGALQNARIKQQEHITAQQELIKKLSKYNTQAKQQPASVNINDPLALSLKYQSNLYKQTKEWEAINNNLNIEITRLYPKYSSTPAGKLLADAQKLLSEAKTTNELNKKLELNIKAAQLQQQAMQQLSATTPPVVTNNNPTNPPTITQQNKPNQQNNITTTQTTNNFLTQIKSIKVTRSSPYSESNPIPLNPDLPKGLIFSVQVGAFKNPLPNNFFNGISPIFAQTTNNNLYRYLVGQMQDPQEAIALKNNFRNLGYTDAFVIAYYNGKRISLSEALELLKKEKQQEVKLNPFATTNVLEKANIPTYTTLIATTQQQAETNSIKEAEEINDLFYTIQIGVYGKNVSDATFQYIQPIIRNKIDDKFYRYSAGIYNDITQIQNDLKKVINLGMKDAFICAYWNGKRIFYPQAEKLTRENKTIRYASPQPIIFPNESASIGINQNPTIKNAIIETNNNAPPFNPMLVFSNGITKRPEPTPENGVKANNTGICFRVQIGAFKNKVPQATAEKYFKIKNWPIDVHYINGLYIYTVGNFVSAKFAAKLREEVISYGITDAFITVYQDNKKLFGYEAMKYMGQSSQ